MLARGLNKFAPDSCDLYYNFCKKIKRAEKLVS